MKVYDPNIAPDPQQWPQLDEQLRINLAEQHHRPEEAKLPNAEAHAIFHVIIENQIAEGLEPVQRAMKRLTGEGLSRHVSERCACRCGPLNSGYKGFPNLRNRVIVFYRIES